MWRPALQLSPWVARRPQAGVSTMCDGGSQAAEKTPSACDLPSHTVPAALARGATLADRKNCVLSVPVRDLSDR